MRVMKFISVAAILLVISGLAMAQQAPAESTPILKHVPITNAPSNSGKQMYDSYCAVCHGKDANEDCANRSQPACQQRWRKIPRRSRRCRYSRTGEHAIPWQPGHAGLGTFVLQHQPGTRSASASASHQSRQLHRRCAGKMNLQVGLGPHSDSRIEVEVGIVPMLLTWAASYLL